ncbi:MAG: hypothetical protein PF541_00050 [Prolixibacteraceae bacterium]|jgi:glucosylceramidase|nr:hypothetical protein [Prolixibacteraceae bacterium]
MKKFSILLIASALIASCTQQNISIVTTTEQHAWLVEKEIQVIDTEAKADVIIDRSKTDQTMEGFGGCFNELGWEAITSLTETDQETIFNEFFTPEVGANFTICRMPVGANDFSLDWYSYNEFEGDFAMDNFSIDNDLNTLIPYIHEAQKHNPNLKVWASPWSPPSWMKWNKHYACASSPESVAEQYRNNLAFEKQGAEGTNMFIQEPAYFNAYALYFKKFVEAYEQQNINIEMVMPQNEWNSCQNFPSCTWTAKGLAEFIGKYLGPTMDEIGVELMLGTMERPSLAMADTILNDPDAAKFIAGVGFQWAGKGAIPGVHKKYPLLKLYQTEQECGNGKNDWKHCLHSWDLMKHYISNGASSYLYWNIALKEGGISRWGWSQNSLITVNKEDKTFRYNHEYYLLKHVSHFVKPGAKLLKTGGAFSNLLAFENPDLSIVLVVQNENAEPKKIILNVDDKNISISLKANSFSSVVIKSVKLSRRTDPERS